jgi:ribonuclease Z
MLGLTILGNNSAVPAYGRHPTSQILTVGNELIMIDCGEGTQIQLMKYKIRRTKISKILISHLHGDHYFGLIGLLNSFGLLGRTQDLEVFAPGHLNEIIQLQLQAGDVTLPYKLTITEIKKSGLLFEDNQISVHCFPTNHRIICYGFMFRELAKQRKILLPQCIANEIPLSYFTKLKNGADYIKKDGTLIKNETVTEAGAPARTYAFCADTKYDESVLPYISNVDLLYHETTYLDNFQLKAAERFHSTTGQAATIALKANAKKLIIGHFSSKYEHLDLFETEARTVFANTEIANEGVSYII